MKLLMVSNNLSGNGLGRAYCIWLSARAAGYDPIHVIGPAKAGIWPIVAGTSFADACTEIAPGRAGAAVAEQMVRSADVLLAVKPLPASFGLALRLAHRFAKPLVLDIDDPDLDVLLAQRSRRARMGLVGRQAYRQGKHPIQLRWLQHHIQRTPRLVSNPVLQRRYGGDVLPHVREHRPAGAPHTSRAPLVAFIGTVRAHKGLDLLRDAVQQLADEGFRLAVTGPPPADARPWESWIGTVDLEQGLALVDAADIVALPSRPSRWADGQLPVKLIDAMMGGRAIVASDLEVMRWASAGTILLVRPEAVDDLVRALRHFQDPVRRAALGLAARNRALEMFTPEANRMILPSVMEQAVASHRSR